MTISIKTNEYMKCKIEDLTNQLSCNYKTKYKEVLDVHIYIRDREG